MFQNFREIEIDTSALFASRSRKQERFLKGPIPMSEIIEASKLPGKALAVYLAIQHQTDLQKTQEVTVPARLLKDIGITRDAKSRCLRELEAAGLISVKRAKGRTCRVKLQRAPQRMTLRYHPE